MSKTISANEEIVRAMPSYVFKNEYGEQFNIYSDGILTFMGGDEVRTMVDNKYKIGEEIIPLFNQCFNIWNRNELYQLGKALQVLNAPIEPIEKEL